MLNGPGDEDRQGDQAVVGGSEDIFDHDEAEGVAVDGRVELYSHHADAVGDEVDGQEQQEAGEGQAVLLLSRITIRIISLSLSLSGVFPCSASTW